MFEAFLYGFIGFLFALLLYIGKKKYDEHVDKEYKKLKVKEEDIQKIKQYSEKLLCIAIVLNDCNSYELYEGKIRPDVVDYLKSLRKDFAILISNLDITYFKDFINIHEELLTNLINNVPLTNDEDFKDFKLYITGLIVYLNFDCGLNLIDDKKIDEILESKLNVICGKCKEIMRRYDDNHFKCKECDKIYTFNEVKENINNLFDKYLKDKLK